MQRERNGGALTQFAAAVQGDEICTATFTKRRAHDRVGVLLGNSRDGRWIVVASCDFTLI